jgi:hypothetical protein
MQQFRKGTNVNDKYPGNAKVKSWYPVLATIYIW